MSRKQEEKERSKIEKLASTGPPQFLGQQIFDIFKIAFVGLSLTASA